MVSQMHSSAAEGSFHTETEEEPSQELVFEREGTILNPAELRASNVARLCWMVCAGTRSENRQG